MIFKELNSQKIVKKSCSLEHGLKQDDILHFLHIPKAAGTTLISIIDGYFDRRKEVLGLHAWKYLLPKMPLDFAFASNPSRSGIGFMTWTPLASSAKPLSTFKNGTTFLTSQR